MTMVTHGIYYRNDNIDIIQMLKTFLSTVYKMDDENKKIIDSGDEGLGNITDGDSEEYEVVEIKKTTKPKRQRSEAQIKAFEKAQEVRKQKIQERKTERVQERKRKYRTKTIEEIKPNLQNDFVSKDEFQLLFSKYEELSQKLNTPMPMAMATEGEPTQEQQGEKPKRKPRKQAETKPKIARKPRAKARVQPVEEYEHEPQPQQYQQYQQHQQPQPVNNYDMYKSLFGL